MRSLALLMALLSLLGGGCKSSGSPSCKTDGGTVLADSAWPKFRKDQANTGRTQAAIPESPDVQRLFPPLDAGFTIGGILGSAVLAPDRIYLGSNDTNVYVFDFDGQLVELDEQMDTDGAVVATPVLGADGTLFVVSGDGTIRQFETDGKTRKTTTIGGFISASPNIGIDGTVYFGTQQGTFTGVCANGAPRFLRSTAPTASPPAVIPDPQDPDKNVIIVGAADNGHVRGFDLKGRLRWSLFASAAVSAAVVIEESTQRFFVADANGRMFAGSLADGSPDDGFFFRAAAAISSSPALGDGVLYVGDELGNFYAVDSSSGDTRWQWSASDDILANDGIEDVGTSIFSSPALSTPAGAPQRTVFGVDIDPADVFCRLEPGCTTSADCPVVNCCSDGACSRTGTSCSTPEDCERINVCENGTCAVRRGDCACDRCARVNVCIEDTCTLTENACTSDADCPSENFCVQSFLYAIQDGTEPVTLWRVPFDAPISTASPSIGDDGTIYIGTEAGILYTIAD